MNEPLKSPFAKAHASVRLASEVGGRSCLRTSQLGALHAVASHFTLSSEPGLVVLPTGAGKTAVLMLLPYVLSSTRALVVTPSQFVRAQIASDLASLKTLKVIGALPMDVPAPAVHEVKSVRREVKDWEFLRDFDAVVTTPSSASPGIDTVASPPPDLFDIVLVDEAHHSAAKTWKALIEAFPNARTVLFTATPFRRDRREIRARHLYTYPIQRAFEDGIYGEMEYRPITPTGNESSDAALARAAAAQLKSDLEAGHHHSLMVRAESRSRASELMECYARETDLRLELVHSALSPRTVEKSIKKLRDGDLDGVVCVNMLGEGFDLPRLKVAALHAPHRSLSVTLQFFGRFARVSAGLGTATFLADPAETEEDLQELFVRSEAWGQRIRLLGQKAVGAAIEAKEVIQEFEAQEGGDSPPRLEDVSLHSFSVFNHVQALHVYGDVDLYAAPAVEGYAVEKVWVNQEQRTVAFLLREEVRPDWATTPGFERIEYQLVVCVWESEASILFICSSSRQASLYNQVAASFVTGKSRRLSLSRTNRVLRPFRSLELFNVGIRNRAHGVVAESYRQMTGSAAHNSLDKADSRLYHRGHIFGKGETPKGESTIGISSMGKIWRLETTRIPGLIKWCRALAEEIANPTTFKTGIPLDHFDAGSEVERIPDEIVLAADWDEQLYKKPWTVAQLDEPDRTVSVLDLELMVGTRGDDGGSITVELLGDVNTRLVLRLDPVPSLGYESPESPRIVVRKGLQSRDLLEELTEDHIRFHFADGSVLQGVELFRRPDDEAGLFDVAGSSTEFDWEALNVDPCREFEPGDDPSGPPAGGGRVSIHHWLRGRLVESDAEFVVYDHRSGECADFVTLRDRGTGSTAVTLYHCKGAGGPRPGDRESDAVNVCGQSMKSAKFRNRRLLLKHLKRRLRSRSQLLKGDLGELIALLEADPSHEISLSIFVVQPGFPLGTLSDKLGRLLGTTNQGIVAQGCQPLHVYASA